MFEFRLPDIGEGISEALLIAWTVAEGDQVVEDDEIATISTDKVDVELPAPRSGKVVELLWKPGDTIPVGEILVRIDDGNGSVGAEPEKKAKTKSKATAAAEVKAPPPAPAEAAAIITAPATRKLAAEMGIDLAAVSGSGQEGRILKRDLEAFTAKSPATAARPSPDRPEVTREGLSGPRMAAFERLSQSVHTLAHSTMSFEVRADGIQELLAKLAPAAEAEGVRLTHAALFAVCASRALVRHPRFNATIDEENRELLLHRDVNMSIAVASDNGLLVPVVRNMDTMSLFSAARAVADVAGRGRDARLMPGDMQGGTFTLSNTGNLERATLLSTRPIINPPQTATLWMSRINDRPRAVDGELSVGPMLACSLSFDHRFIDGADGTLFINDLAALLECPEAAMATGS